MNRAARRIADRLRLVALLVMLCLVTLLPASAQTPPATDTRGAAEVGISCNLTTGNPWDQVSLRLVDKTDSQPLHKIAAELAQRFNVPPQYLDVRPATARDTNMIEDKGVGVLVGLPAVPRDGSGILPFGPFVEAFAPYASRVDIVYVVTGPFTFKGMSHDDTADVSYNVDPPDIAPPMAGVPTLAVYGVHVTIKHPQVAAGSVPVQPPVVRHSPPWLRPLLVILGIAVVITALALALAYGVLPLLKKWAAAASQPQKGENDGK